MKHHNLQKDVNLYDLIDLVHIPEANRVFTELVKRLGQYFGDSHS